jgi:phosphoinositide-3-kinase regulatory subunit 4
VVKLLGESDSVVKRALLKDITRICIFLGRQRANDILSHITCYLNESDWRLRRALFEGIIGLAAFVGGKSLEYFILPLLGAYHTSVFEHAVAILP